MSEQAPLLPSTTNYIPPDLVAAQAHLDEDEKSGWQGWIGEILEAKMTHVILLVLIAIDACFVFTDLGYTFLVPGTCHNGHPESPETPEWLETIAKISLGITTLFLVEIPLETFAFGWKWWAPWSGIPHAGLHLLDALVIIGTFIIEVFLKGKDKELASLLILLRLWRLIKLVGGVAVGVGEWDESSANRLLQAEKKVALLEREVQLLRQMSPDELARSNEAVRLMIEEQKMGRGAGQNDCELVGSGNGIGKTVKPFTADVSGPLGDRCDRSEDGGDGHEDQTNVWKDDGNRS